MQVLKNNNITFKAEFGEDTSLLDPIFDGNVTPGETTNVINKSNNSELNQYFTTIPNNFDATGDREFVLNSYIVKADLHKISTNRHNFFRSYGGSSSSVTDNDYQQYRPVNTYLHPILFKSISKEYRETEARKRKEEREK